MGKKWDRVTLFCAFKFFNPFAHESPVQIHIPYTGDNFFSFNGQGQLWPTPNVELFMRRTKL